MRTVENANTLEECEKKTQINLKFTKNCPISSSSDLLGSSLIGTSISILQENRFRGRK